MTCLRCNKTRMWAVIVNKRSIGVFLRVVLLYNMWNGYQLDCHLSRIQTIILGKVLFIDEIMFRIDQVCSKNIIYATISREREA